MGFGSFLKSALSGGLSDLVEGDAPFTGALESAGAPNKLLALNDLVGQALNPGIRGYQSLKGLLGGDVGWGQAVDYAIDIPRYDKNWHNPAERKGMVDWGQRNVGAATPDWAKKDIINPVGTVISGILGPGYAAGFQGLYGKSTGRDYDENFKAAGMAALASYLAQQASGAATSGVGAESSGLAETGADVGMDEPGWTAPDSWNTPDPVAPEYGYPTPDTSPMPPPTAPGTPQAPGMFDALSETGKEVAQQLIKKYATPEIMKLFMKDMPAMPEMMAPAYLSQNWGGFLSTPGSEAQTAPGSTGMPQQNTQWQGTEPELQTAAIPISEKQRIEELLNYLKNNPQYYFESLA